MIAKTRSDFLQTVTAYNVKEKDINNMQWDKFVINRPITYYRVSHADLQRPDLICQKIYNTMQYFWVLMKFNEIDDIWNDITEGDTIMCPSFFDIEQYFSMVTTNV
jgi:hypothetical protein